MEMTIKYKISRQYNHHEPKSTLALSFRLCLLFLIVCILTPLACTETISKDIDPISLLEFPLPPGSKNVNISNAAGQSNNPSRIQQPFMQIANLPSDQWQTQIDRNIPTNFTAKVDIKTSHFFLAKNPTTDLSRQLWQARISASKDRKSNPSKNELQQIIKQVESVEFKPQEQTPKPLIVVEPIRQTEPNEFSSDTEMLQEPQPDNIKRKLPNDRVTDRTLQILKTLSKKPDQLHDPFELAEILFNSNCLKEAAKCYQQALDSITAGQTDQFTDKEWILFQIGNCLRNTDRQTAMQMYSQLIAEYPDSPWVDLAKAKSKLIDWYLKDKPDVMINENKL
jgi:tetratricopeptide (TPR) repeat protein